MRIHGSLVDNSEREKWGWILLVFALLTNASGVYGDIFTGDSILYASLSKNMIESGHYLDLFVNGKDWLDKPHFPFWIATFSMKLFGITSFAYKLPALLFFFMSVFYTFRLGSCLYNRQVGLSAAIVLSCSLHIITSNNDVRAEVYLMGLMTGAIFHFYRLRYGYLLKDLLIASFFTGCAIMTKGIFICIPMAFSVIGPLIWKKDFSAFLQRRWLAAIFLSFIFASPAIYAVYQQFDLHPEKVVFGKKGVSGIRFFFWDSQFGRFTNQGPIKGKGSYFFFFITLLWAFAPWGLTMYVIFFRIFVGLGSMTRRIWRKREVVTFSAFLVMFVIFSMSRFQLPHYTNILFPLLAIIVAAFWDPFMELNPRLLFYLQKFYWFLLLSVVGILQLWMFRPGSTMLFFSLLLIILSFELFLQRSKFQDGVKLFFSSGFISCMVALYLNFIFMPALLKYQAGAQVARYLNERTDRPSLITGETDLLLEFYYKGHIQKVFGQIQPHHIEDTRNVVVFSGKEDISRYLGSYKHEIIREFEGFHITRLTSKFLNFRTRGDATKKYVLARIRI